MRSIASWLMRTSPAGSFRMMPSSAGTTWPSMDPPFFRCTTSPSATVASRASASGTTAYFMVYASKEKLGKKLSRLPSGV